MIEIFDDIKKNYKFHFPCQKLSSYIEYFWEYSFQEVNNGSPVKGFSLKLFPSWTPTILINLGSPYHLFLGREAFSLNMHNDILIFRNSIIEYQHVATNHLFGVKFFPGGINALLNINQAIFAKSHLALNYILPSQLIQQIKSLNAFNDRVEVLQHFLLLNKKRNAQDHYFMLAQEVIETYRVNNMALDVSEIADKKCITPKTLYRNFIQVTGVTPKTYFATMRARAALTSYVHNKRFFVPFEYGYYDMSHFYKDVVKFTGKKLLDNL